MTTISIVCGLSIVVPYVFGCKMSVNTLDSYQKFRTPPGSRSPQSEKATRNCSFSVCTPTFHRSGFFNSNFQNPSENSDFAETLMDACINKDAAQQQEVERMSDTFLNSFDRRQSKI